MSIEHGIADAGTVQYRTPTYPSPQEISLSNLINIKSYYENDISQHRLLGRGTIKRIHHPKFSGVTRPVQPFFRLLKKNNRELCVITDETHLRFDGLWKLK